MRSHVEAFETTVQKTNAWINEVARNLGIEDQRVAYRATRAVLHAIRDRLTVEEVADLGAQLTMLMRGFYYEGWDPSKTPVRIRQQELFLKQIDRELEPDDPLDAEPAAQAVFAVLRRHVAEGEIEDILHVIPADIRALWTTPGVPAATRP